MDNLYCHKAAESLTAVREMLLPYMGNSAVARYASCDDLLTEALDVHVRHGVVYTDDPDSLPMTAISAVREIACHLTSVASEIEHRGMDGYYSRPCPDEMAWLRHLRDELAALEEIVGD